MSNSGSDLRFYSATSFLSLLSKTKKGRGKEVVRLNTTEQTGMIPLLLSFHLQLTVNMKPISTMDGGKREPRENREISQLLNCSTVPITPWRIDSPFSSGGVGVNGTV